MLILGINAFHADAAACIVRDGVLLAAVEEERFRRVKHWAGFPAQAIAYCLREAGARLEDVDHVALNQDSRAQFWRKLRFVLARRPSPAAIARRLANRRQRSGIAGHFAAAFPGVALAARLHGVEHHLCHLASAFHVSPFDEAAAVSVDGFGDFSSAAWGMGSGTELAVDGRVFFPHSLGVFYQALTQYLGFPGYGDEYKVMGLAPYGKPAFMDEMRRIVRLHDDGAFSLDLAYFRHHKENVPYQWDDGSPEIGDLFSPALAQLLGPPRARHEPLTSRHHDIAHSVQAMYEAAFFHLLSRLQARTGARNVVIAGGCGMNSVANGKIRRATPFENVYVQAAAGDAGGAIGAACVVWHRLGGKRAFVMDHAYWGPAFSQDDVETVVAGHAGELAAEACVIETIAAEDELCERTAAAIAAGKVVGWFQGRLEWGPRALGNRSILCDPRRPDMKDLLNAKIKRRESFRPFAPSVLEEHAGDWFEEEAPVPFMMQVFQIRADRRATIPAVTHVDGSGRLQTVSAAANPRYHRLIDAFRRRTGVPMLLNTSFNENEPIVCRPQEALSCFLRTRMDVLVLGDVYIERRA